jgi:4-carboxymuconolactone decarboxylase
MSRLKPPELHEMTPEQRRVHDKVVGQAERGALVGPFRAALLRPEILDKWDDLARAVRIGATLPLRLRELAILVTARHWGAKIEWLEHVPPALKQGIAEEVIRAIRERRAPAFGKDDERDVFAFCTELYRDHKVSQSTYDRVLGHLGQVGIMELTMVMGLYGIVSFTLIAHELQPLKSRAVDAVAASNPGLEELLRLQD